MKRIVWALLVSCAHAPPDGSVVIAPPSDRVPAVVAVGQDVVHDGGMNLAWSYVGNVASYAIAKTADGSFSLLVRPNNDDRFDLLDPATGKGHGFPITHGWTTLRSTGSSIVLASRVDRVDALDPTGARLFTLQKSGTSVIGATSTPEGVVVHIGGGLVESYAPNGTRNWTTTVPASTNRIRAIPGAIVVWNEPMPLSWTLLDPATGRSLAAATEQPTGNLATFGNRFVTCSNNRISIRAANGAVVHSFAGTCGELVLGEDVVYVLSSSNGEVRALALDGSQRWSWRGNVSHAIAYGPWLLVTTQGGLVRALRQKDGAIAWSYGAGAHPMIDVAGERLFVSAGDELFALERTPESTPDRTSDIAITVHDWDCVDPAQTLLFVGDEPAHSVGNNQFSARVTGRGRVLVRTLPYADISPTGSRAYREMSVEIDGRTHALDVDILSCDED